MKIHKGKVSCNKETLKNGGEAARGFENVKRVGRGL